MRNNDCSFTGHREDVLIGYVYGESDPAERAVFESHLAACRTCRDEVAELRAVRANLERWSPPELERLVRPAALSSPARRWWQEVPVWAQTAAALLFVGVAASVANLDVRYDRSGLSVHTGWMTPAAVASAPGDRVQGSGSSDTAVPWRSDLVALERRLRSDMQAVPAVPTAQVPAESRSGASGDQWKQMRALVTESERKQQRELALRIAEVLHDMQIERQADLVRIERSLGTIQNNTGVEVMRQRQLLNSLAVRVSQRQ